MKIVTANVNGIRAAGRKGFFEWIRKTLPNVVCIQETKAQIEQLSDALYHPEGYHCFYHDAQKKGYSGVALYCRQQPDKVVIGMGNKEFDSEGRYIEAIFGNLSVISVYMPSGSSKEARQQVKYRCMDHMMIKLAEMKASGRDYILCGDWNIAHKNEDIRNWKGNLKKLGILAQRTSLARYFIQRIRFRGCL